MPDPSMFALGVCLSPKRYIRLYAVLSDHAKYTEDFPLPDTGYFCPITGKT